MTYWEDTLSEILDENGVTASWQQVVEIAKAIQGAYKIETEALGMADAINPSQTTQFYLAVSMWRSEWEISVPEKAVQALNRILSDLNPLRI